MPTTISCPDCQRKLNLPDEFLGKEVKGPGGGASFTAAATPPAGGGEPPAWPAIEDEPRAPRKPPEPTGEEVADRPSARPRREEDVGLPRRRPPGYDDSY